MTVCAQRLTVEHETLYRYAHAVDMAQHIACLRPLSDEGQVLEQFEMGVSPLPAQHSTRRDAFGNSRAYFALNAAHKELKVVARSQVQVRPRYQGLDPTKGATCGEARELLTYRAEAPFESASEFAYASPYVPTHDELRDYGAESLKDDRPLAEAVIELMMPSIRWMSLSAPDRSGSCPNIDPIPGIYCRMLLKLPSFLICFMASRNELSVNLPRIISS